jgi:polyhydroxybutyrate depolymerase
VKPVARRDEDTPRVIFPRIATEGGTLRGCLKIASWAVVLPLIVFAGFAFWALRSKLPAEPRLPGKIERGALEHGGRTRTWIAYVPTKPQAHPALVIALHGSMGTAAQARQHYGYDFDRLAEEHGFIAVYPQGYKATGTTVN